MELVHVFFFNSKSFVWKFDMIKDMFIGLVSQCQLLSETGGRSITTFGPSEALDSMLHNLFGSLIRIGTGFF